MKTDKKQYCDYKLMKMTTAQQLLSSYLTAVSIFFNNCKNNSLNEFAKILLNHSLISSKKFFHKFNKCE